MIDLGLAHLLRLGGPEDTAECVVSFLPFLCHSGHVAETVLPVGSCRIAVLCCCCLKGFAALDPESPGGCVCRRDTVRLGWTLCSLDPPDSWFMGLSGGVVTPSAVCWAQAAAPWRELGCTRRGSVPRVATLPVPARGGLDECLAV